MDLDPRVPFWHVLRYRLKTLLRGSSDRYSILPVPRFGHCAFQPDEALAAFALLVSKVTGFDLVHPDRVEDVRCAECKSSE